MSKKCSHCKELSPDDFEKCQWCGNIFPESVKADINSPVNKQGLGNVQSSQEEIAIIENVQNRGGIFMDHNMTTTTFTLEGFRIVQTLGLVRGITVRSRSIIGTFGAGLQTLFGGNITLLTDLCETARQEAYDMLIEHAALLGANAVIGIRYDATQVMSGVTEVICYGTAVKVERI